MSRAMKRRRTFSFSPSLWHGSLVLCAELASAASAENQLNSTRADAAKRAFSGTDAPKAP